MKNLLCRYLVLFIFMISIIAGCAHKSLVTEHVSPEYYPVKKILPDTLNHNPTFLIYGDSRPGWRLKERFLSKSLWRGWSLLLAPVWIAHGFAGTINFLRYDDHFGTPEREMVRNSILNAFKKNNADFVLGMGDYISDGRYANHWELFLKENKAQGNFLETMPFVPVIGNHEHATDPEFGEKNYRAIFEYPRFFTLEFPDASIFVVDSDLLLDQYGDIPDSTQEVLFNQWFVSKGENSEPAWLEKELENCKKKFKIIAMHHPPVSFAKHHIDWQKTEYCPQPQEKLGQFLNMLERYGVQLVLASHEHYYEHSIVGNDKKMHIIVSGGGGVPLRELHSQTKVEEYLSNYKKIGLTVDVLKRVKSYHYCQLQISENGIKFDAVEATNAGQGKKIDSFEILP